MTKINVLIADDMQILRTGLKAILEKNDTLQVVGMAANGKEAYEFCQNAMVDVILMDMHMPDYDGAYGIKSIKNKFPNIKILVLSTFDDDNTVKAAVNSGADGYILKEMEAEQIIQSIISTYNGLSIFCNHIYKNISSRIHFSDIPSDTEKSFHFSTREKELIHYITQGLDNKEISQKMYLAEGTVRNNISKLLIRLNMKDRTQLAVFAVKNGLD